MNRHYNRPSALLRAPEGWPLVQDAWRLNRGERPAVSLERLDELAVAVARGQRAAFEEIYVELAEDIYTYARAHCESASDAEDVVATVFLKAWQHAQQYRSGHRTYRHWIFGIARNEVRNHWRALKASRQLAIQLQAARPEGSDDQLPDVDPRVVEAALNRLTPEQREVIVLRYFSEKSHRAIAEIMGKREGSVRALQFRALRQLKKAVSNAST